jgi:hypothetical protein
MFLLKRCSASGFGNRRVYRPKDLHKTGGVSPGLRGQEQLAGGCPPDYHPPDYQRRQGWQRGNPLLTQSTDLYLDLPG